MDRCHKSAERPASEPCRDNPSSFPTSSLTTDVLPKIAHTPSQLQLAEAAPADSLREIGIAERDAWA